MRIDKRYRITVEDESKLEKKIDLRTRMPILLLIGLGIVAVAGCLGVFILASTPLKNYLPGYLKESERTATEEQHLRLDSLVRVYEVNEAYITGILNALIPTEDESYRGNRERKPTPLSLDSLLPASEEEKAFMESIRERDKYNIPYTSPAAAQTMMFGKVNKAAVITEESKDQYQAEILLPAGGAVTTIAEGKVISVASSPRASGGYEVIIQHPKGFLSKSSRLTNLVVRPGDRLSAGEIIATGTVGEGMRKNVMVFELWHDGDPLIPGRFLPTPALP